MLIEDFEKLTNSDKEEFKRLISMLLAKTFVVRDIYDTKENMVVISKDYRFLERHFPLISDYLAIGGWDLLQDVQYGVIYLENVYEYNRMKLDRFSTLALYTIRLIYEEGREKVTLQNEIVTTVGEVVHKMMTLGVQKKKPSARDLTEVFRLMAYHNLIQKIDGLWDSADTKILILPAILFVVSNERIGKIYEMLGKAETDGEEELFSETETIIRGEGYDEELEGEEVR